MQKNNKRRYPFQVKNELLLITLFFWEHVLRPLFIFDVQAFNLISVNG